jgi:hypothetical protein
MAAKYHRHIFEYPLLEFSHHLGQENNDRIIFSGKYGTGKTKFLDDFFSDEHQNKFFHRKKYEVFRIFPINYSIASNEDIFKYIKYDLILELLNKGYQLNDVDLRLIDTAPEFLKKHFLKVIFNLVGMIPKVGKTVSDFYSKIETLWNEHKDFNDEVNTQEGKKLVDYLESAEAKEGSIFEEDIITKIITTAINKMSSENGTTSMLLIDDIDRLDPEHVFRLLNVFAAHFDLHPLSEKKNKFNFDKVILVCDFRNIRNIFHHRYGTNVDFMGYIDKFFTNDIYYFDNRKAIVKIVDEIFRSIKFTDANQHEESVYWQVCFQDNFLIHLISDLVSNNKITLRTVAKLYDKRIHFFNEEIFFGNSIGDIRAWRNSTMVQLRIIEMICGDFFHTYQILKAMNLSTEFVNNHKRNFGALIYLMSYRQNGFVTQNRFLFKYGETAIVVSGNTRHHNDMLESVELSTWENKWGDNSIPQKGAAYILTPEIFKSVLLDSLQLLHDVGFIK